MSRTHRCADVPNDDLSLVPTVRFLTEQMAQSIIDEALGVLARTGVLVESSEAESLLLEAGCSTEASSDRVRIPERVVLQCVENPRPALQLFSRDASYALSLSDSRVHFVPGSAALNLLDDATQLIRKPVTDDLVAFARLTDALPHLACQSTALVSSDVPEAIADRYRLYVGLRHCSKPIVTGTFLADAFAPMRDMLVAVRGSEAALRERPLAIFDACPSPPLKWSDLTAQTLIDCARSGIPAELVSMPLLGATAPATLCGALVQQTAENLSGLVIHQLAAPGSPIIFGGSPSAFDMRHGTTPMGAVETVMLNCAAAQIGRQLGLPTHGYVGLSDAKLVDAQAGLESGIGAIMAALAGINIVAGAGMLDFENCQSMAKLVLDNEVCGMAKRAIAGVQPRSAQLAGDLFGPVDDPNHFLTSPSTRQWFREEVSYPSQAIDRRSHREWQSRGGLPAQEQARSVAQDILASHAPSPLPESVAAELTEIMTAEATRHGMAELPGEAAR